MAFLFSNLFFCCIISRIMPISFEIRCVFSSDIAYRNTNPTPFNIVSATIMAPIRNVGSLRTLSVRCICEEYNIPARLAVLTAVAILSRMKELCLSGIQPTNVTHIGNYIGALKLWAEMQNRYPCLFPIVDLHAITVPQDPKKLRENILNAAATYLATGIDIQRSHIFIQSEVAEHAELGWILQTITKMGELERMTQYQDKAAKNITLSGAGLFT